MAPRTNHSPQASPFLFAYQPQKQAVMAPATIQNKIELMIALMMFDVIVFSGWNNYFQSQYLCLFLLYLSLAEKP